MLCIIFLLLRYLFFFCDFAFNSLSTEFYFQYRYLDQLTALFWGQSPRLTIDVSSVCGSFLHQWEDEVIDPRIRLLIYVNSDIENKKAVDSELKAKSQ
jgi:hypothetical protein